jgi:hypothetical protein
MKNPYTLKCLIIFLLILQTACAPFIKINRDFEKRIVQQKSVEQPRKPQFAANFEVNSKFAAIEEEILIKSKK